MRYFGHFRGFNIFLLNLEVSRGILVILKVSRLLWRFRGILGHFRYYGGILVIVVFIYLFIIFFNFGYFKGFGRYCGHFGGFRGILDIRSTF